MLTKFKGIVLASISPRRKKLLESMGIKFIVIPSKLVEMPPMGDLPNTYSARMAMEKAVKVGQEHPDHLIIGADTVVALDGLIMGKPASTEEASVMLSRLSGQWHDVWTGICVYNKRHAIEIVRAVRTQVRFRELTLEEIDAYIQTGEPMDKAGAYGIQGKGSTLVREITGSYHNVIGLPTLELGKILDALGVSNNSSLTESFF